MRTQRRLAASLMLVLGVARPCPATQLPWVGTLAFEFPTSRPSRPIAIIGTGVASVNASGGGVHLAELRLAGGITGTATLPLTDPDTATLISLRIAASLGTGTFLPLARSSQSRPLTRRTLPVAGIARLCTLFPGCSSSLPIPLTVNDGQTGVGIGGLLTVGGFAKSGPAISVQAAPWTIGSTTVLVTTSRGEIVPVAASGWRHGAFTFTSSTALTGGSVSLVTPMTVMSQMGQALSIFVRLTVRFIPEPAPGLLIALGCTALIVLGHRRIQP